MQIKIAGAVFTDEDAVVALAKYAGPVACEPRIEQAIPTGLCSPVEQSPYAIALLANQRTLLDRGGGVVGSLKAGMPFIEQPRVRIVAGADSLVVPLREFEKWQREVVMIADLAIGARVDAADRERGADARISIRQVDLLRNP